MAEEGEVSIDTHVVKNPQCGCCNAWIEILAGEGFYVTKEDRSSSEPAAFKVERSKLQKRKILMVEAIYHSRHFGRGRVTEELHTD
jgi:hypothetical protein